ncbi:FadR/GntR family transcriptional regulator [Geomicrobium sp. JCM 19038]|uniref:FadR/GntR family transcriptional regulator n=1 Tax=Geomicrobium sp. JCM 19038 TaxID=1460635 RepID=UPI00045F16F6|nr:FadR/GntR family transcriptional regulator [Geomicrobium sp. JCM 19038]GAK09897.1 predicted 5-dehydro-4-deoxyglucarate regulator YcbG [Geomicrobium sp. JCM 19038]
MRDFEANLIDKKVKRTTLAQHVEESIVDLLMTNKLKPGDKLPPEMELIDMLGVSRPVLREAITSLESLGIVKRKTRDGTYFTERISSKPFKTMLSLMNDNIEGIIEARMTLELGLVTLAAEKITDEQLEVLHETIVAIETKEDNDYGRYDLEFHHIIASSVDNPIMQGMMDSLLLAHEKVNKQIQYREKEKTVAHHRAIYNGLKERNPQVTFEAMYRHLTFVRDKVLNQQ